MKTTVSLDNDLSFDASEEAKICLNCPKKRCTGGYKCELLRQSLEAIKNGAKKEENSEKG